MFFRILTVIVLATTLGCSLRIGEKPAQNPEINLGDQVGCLSDMGVVLSRFLNGDIEDEELDKFGECAIYSIETFKTYTVGEKDEEYHPGEIRHFLQQYFMKDKTITDELLNQVMNLKILILGGNKESITRDELTDFIEIVRVWKKEFISLNRYMKIYNWTTSKELQREFPATTVDASIAALKVFASNMLGTFKGRLVRYDFNDFEKLMKEFRQFTNWSEVHTDKARPAEHWTLFIQTFRKISFNDSDPTILVEDMPPVVVEMADWLGLVIKYKYFLRGHKVDREPGLTHLNSWVQDIHRLLNNAVIRHPDEQIHYDDLLQFLLALENFFAFPLNIKAHDVHEFFPKIFETILTPKSQGRSLAPNAGKYFRRDYLARAMAIYSDWYEIQSHLSRNYPNENAIENQQTDNIWFNPNVTLYPFGANNAISDLRRIIRGIPPIYRQDEATAFFVEIKRAYSYQVSHDFFNLSRMNLFRTLLGLAMRGYSSKFDPESIMNSTMTADELQNLYADLKPLGVKIGLLDPRSTKAGYRSFNEANLFTYVSDGIGPRAEMSFEEGMLLVAYLWSGSQLSKSIYEDLIQRCELGENDLQNRKMISRPCVERELGTLIRSNLTTMPGLEEYLESLDQEKLDAYAKDLLTSSYSVHSVEGWVEKSELNVVAMIIHYAESVMTRFNQDADQFLERDEVNAAIPLFSGFIREMGKAVCINSMDNQRVKDVFRHIVETGVIPESNGWLSDFGLWREFRARRGDSWEPQFDRGHITSVFASIIAKSLEQGKESRNCEE